MSRLLTYLIKIDFLFVNSSLLFEKEKGTDIKMVLGKLFIPGNIWRLDYASSCKYGEITTIFCCYTKEPEK